MKHRIACGAVGLSVLACTAVSIAEPPPSCVPIPTLECSTVPSLDVGETWIPTTFDWAPNRLPAAVINFRPGVFCSGTGGNYRGLQDCVANPDNALTK
ncbi:MAG: hypothetical protein L6Q35_10730 [Phycisphaerales bacterium]|nr:hypothetical protein [Phycisphaerales bacterium]